MFEMMNFVAPKKLWVVVRSCYAPKSGGGCYRRPVRVLVVSEMRGRYRHGDESVVREWHNVDSRYDGPRSAYGRAIRAARAMVSRGG